MLWNFQMMKHDMGNKLCGLNILAEESAIRDSCSSSIKLGVIRLLFDCNMPVYLIVDIRAVRL